LLSVQKKVLEKIHKPNQQSRKADDLQKVIEEAGKRRKGGEIIIAKRKDLKNLRRKFWKVVWVKV
jgi:cell division protein FtsL